jgi:hypothetical protein
MQFTLRKLETPLAAILLIFYLVVAATFVSASLEMWMNRDSEPEDFWLSLPWLGVVLFAALVSASNFARRISGYQLIGKGFEKTGHALFAALWIWVLALILFSAADETMRDVLQTGEELSGAFGVAGIAVLALCVHIKGLLETW